MTIPIIDAHLHLDLYEQEEREALLNSLGAFGVKGLVAVSMHLDSCRSLLALKRRTDQPIYPAFGYHPEQALPDASEEEQLFRWIRDHREEMYAIGEVGLPYYARLEAGKAGRGFDLEPYIRLLERFIRLAAELEKPIVLHAVYEDADIACDLLEKHGVERAHFHWFKGSEETLQRMKERGYFISVTPDIMYKEKTRDIVRAYPLSLLMVETDGPWPFQGPYEGVRTHPGMIRDSIREIAAIHNRSEAETGEALWANTVRFYRLQG